MLISTGAGGTGLNITSASVVVFIDLSFNPATDKQAEARCHRIGQKHEVDVYKVISKDSLEENMLKLQQIKQSRVDQLIAHDGEAEENISEKEMSSKLSKSLFG